MKVIFLDIDRVLNTNDTFDIIDAENRVSGDLKIYIDEFRLEYLRQIVQEMGLKLF